MIGFNSIIYRKGHVPWAEAKKTFDESRAYEQNKEKRPTLVIGLIIVSLNTLTVTIDIFAYPIQS